MLRHFGWMVVGGILLGSASIAKAQDSQIAENPATGAGVTSGIPGAGYGYSVDTRGLANPAYPGAPLPGPAYGLGGAGYSVPVIGSHKECYTLYPLSTVYPYTYTGPGRSFGAYATVPYPYVPLGYGWYGEHWRGW